MNRQTFLIAFLVAGAAMGQALFSYRDAKGDITLQAKGGRFEQGGNGVQRFFAQGNVDLKSRLQGLRLQGQSIDATAVQGKSGRSELRDSHARGSVRIEKSGAGGQSVVTCSSADVNMVGKLAEAKLSGATTIRSSGGRGGTVTATGSGGSASFDTEATGGSGLRNAELYGPVRIEATQPGGGRLSARGSRLIAGAGMRSLELSGNVSVDGSKSSSFGSLQNVSRVTLRLNEKGEVQSIQVNQ